LAKPRINLRYDGRLLALIKDAVRAGRARDLTDALEAAGAAWLGVDREVPSSEDVAPPVQQEARGRSQRKPRAAAKAEPKAAAGNGARATTSRAVKAAVRPIPKAAGKRK
jgi:hypothetical protein